MTHKVADTGVCIKQYCLSKAIVAPAKIPPQKSDKNHLYRLVLHQMLHLKQENILGWLEIELSINFFFVEKQLN